jgi:hypothetical protein
VELVNINQCSNDSLFNRGGFFTAACEDFLWICRKMLCHVPEEWNACSGICCRIPGVGGADALSSVP